MAWSATGSHASSGIACGTRLGASPLPATAPPPRGRGCASARQDVLNLRDRAGRPATVGVGREAAASCRLALQILRINVRFEPSSAGDIDAAAAVDEAGLERADIAAIQTARGDNRAGGADDGEPENRRRLDRGKEHHGESHQTAAERVAQTIEGDVDERLGGPLLGRRNRRIEQLIAGAIQRARGTPTRRRAQRPGWQVPGATRPAEAAGEQRPGRRARRDTPRPNRSSTARLEDSLHDERDDARGRVVERKEAEQLIAAAVGFEDLRLER